MIINHQQKQAMRFHACERRIDEYIRQLADLAAGHLGNRRAARGRERGG